MLPLKINTTLGGRYVLKERIALNEERGQQVWAVLDTQTNQRLIGKFSNNGQVEWQPDDRAAPQPTEAFADEPSINVPVGNSAPVPVQAVSPPQPPPARFGWRRGVIGVGAALLLGGAAVVYWQRTQPGPNGNVPEPSPLAAAADDTLLTDEPDPFALPDTVPIRAASVWVPERVDARLEQLANVPVAEHASLFSEAERAYTAIRQLPGRAAYAQTRYRECVRRAGLSFEAYQQNGDPTARYYAAEWYRLAYALKPSPLLKNRIDELRPASATTQPTTAQPPIASPTTATYPANPKPAAPRRAKRKPATSPGFMPDPELNQ